MTRIALIALVLTMGAVTTSPSWADQPNQNAGGGPGNSGPGDKASPVEGPPGGADHDFPSDADPCGGAC